MEGDRDLVVSNAAAGAGIRVYDSAGTEIGDGGGRLIALARPLIVNETITVVQDLEPTCSAQVGVDVIVRPIP